MKLEALFDAVIVRPIEEEETMYGNIVVPDLGKDKNEKGTVVAVGPGKPTVTPTTLLINLPKGKTVPIRGVLDIPSISLAAPRINSG